MKNGNESSVRGTLCNLDRWNREEIFVAGSQTNAILSVNEILDLNDYNINIKMFFKQKTFVNLSAVIAKIPL